MPRFRPFGLVAPLGAILLGLALAPVARAEIRVGYVDSRLIFQQYKEAQDAQQRFDRQVLGWREEATEKEKVVKQLREEVRDQAPILSALKRQEKEEALQRAISEYERFIQEIWGPNGRAAKENELATSKVVDQIRTAVEKVAGEKNLSLVLDSAAGFILYADKTLDLTGDVLIELNTRIQGSSAR
jgi:Skp family chaperone for outer membrane proteins